MHEELSQAIVCAIAIAALEYGILKLPVRNKKSIIKHRKAAQKMENVASILPGPRACRQNMITLVSETLRSINDRHGPVTKHQP